MTTSTDIERQMKVVQAERRKLDLKESREKVRYLC